MTLKRFACTTSLCAMLFAAAGTSARAGEQTCQGPAVMGVSRTIEIDGAAGGLYGSMSARANHNGLLQKKEIVLTFDDGPMPWITKSILDTLDKACVKGTFFSVGRMALAYPSTVREVIARGHTLGTHTYSHPFNMPRMKREKAQAEIEQGFAAVAVAAGAPIAPFFRFTGLSDSAALVDYLGTRHIAAFTVDVVSNDSYIHDVDQLTKRTVAEVEARKGGIILFHDIKTTTAKALPGILAELKARGYSVVHFVPKAPAEPQLDLMAAYASQAARHVAGVDVGQKKLMPFYGTTGPDPVKAKADAKPAASATASAPSAKGWSAQTQRAQVLKGGLDLGQKPKDQHPAATAYSTGFQVNVSATPAAADAKPSKGALWDVVETWTSGAPAVPAAPQSNR